MQLEPDEYIGDEINVIYDENSHILIVQKNRDGLSVRGLEYYINKIWKEKDSLWISLRPILSLGVLEKLNRRETIYRRVTIKFADLKRGTINGKSGSLMRFIKEFQRYEPIYGEVSFSVGTAKTEKLADAEVRNIIGEISKERDAVKQAAISFKSGEDAPVESLDIFDAQEQDFITVQLTPRTSLQSRYVLDMMWEKYKQRRSAILRNLEM